MILCDIGNTHLHFKTRRGICKFKPQDLERDFFEALEGDIYYISVSQSNLSKLLLRSKRCHDISHLIDINTSYQGLGIDRKAACVSVRDGVIIDAGSAISIDVMEDNRHLGGCLLPGIMAYGKAFAGISSALDKPMNMPSGLAQNTQDAMGYGVFESIIGLIERVAKGRRLIFSGGDGRHLSRYFSQSLYDEDLIFRGMALSLKKAGVKEMQ